MIHIDQLSLLALGVVVTIGLGFLLWTLYHLVTESHPHSPAAPGPGSIHLRR